MISIMRNRDFVKINTIFSLFPLFIGITTTEQTTRLLDSITENVQEYNTLIPFPTSLERSFVYQKYMAGSN